MRKYFNKFIGSFAVIIILAGCEATLPTMQQPELTFSNLTPLRLNVKSITVRQTYQPTYKSPYVDHLFKAPPAEIMTNWAKARFQAIGGPDRAVITIKNASVKETRLKQDKSFTGFFTKQQSKRYDMTAEVVVMIVGDGGVPKASATAKAMRTQTLREDASLNKRDQIWFAMEERLMDDLNREVEINAKRYLGPWLR